MKAPLNRNFFDAAAPTQHGFALIEVLFAAVIGSAAIIIFLGAQLAALQSATSRIEMLEKTQMMESLYATEYAEKFTKPELHEQTGETTYAGVITDADISELRRVKFTAQWQSLKSVRQSELTWLVYLPKKDKYELSAPKGRA